MELTREQQAGNVTLHPAVAPQLVNDSELVAEFIRNAAHC